ncbi:MAG: AI-2E family transporter [Treponema sp.]|jgi:predicted PurR-regulated permease PerM|nr:AI-2E family transporter [Treponema sp.]
MEQNDYNRGIFYLLLFICFIGTGVILKLAASVFLPITFALLFTFVMMPVIRNLNKKLHIPWPVGILCMLLLFGAVFFVIGNLLLSSIKAIIGVYPKYEERFNLIYKFIALRFGLSYDSGLNFIENMWNQLDIRTQIQKFALSLSTNIIVFIKDLLIIILLMVFLLSEMRFIKEKVNCAFQNKAKRRVTHIINHVIAEIMRFISIKFFISLTTGLVVFLGTLVIGLDFPIIWGFIAFLLNFIPTFGSIISSVITVLFSVLQFFPHITPMILTALLVISVNTFLGNFLEPRIEGEHLDLSPFIILVCLSMWGWMWGFPGMIVAVPITVSIKIICENVSFLHPVAILLGNDPKNTAKEFSSPEKDRNTTESDDKSEK